MADEPVADQRSARGRQLPGSSAVLVPVKAFHQAKRRLAPVLSPALRQALARQMAERVLRAAAGLPVAVVCDDPAVAAWARRRRVIVIEEPGRGLNGAVAHGVEELAIMGASEVTVAHGDLPLATSLRSLEPFQGVTLVPDRRGDGTNVIRLPTRIGFRFEYGPGSFSRHLLQCRSRDLPHRVVRVAELAHDVDVPADLRGEEVEALLSEAAVEAGPGAARSSPGHRAPADGGARS